MLVTVRLPDELRETVNQSTSMLLRLYDDLNDVAYVVVPETLFERLALLDEDNPELKLQYDHVAKILAVSGDDFGDETVV